MVTRSTCSAIHFHAELLNSLWPNDTLRHYGSCTNLSSCLIHWPTYFDGFWLIVDYCDCSHACPGIILNVTTSYCCMTFWIRLFVYTCSQCAGVPLTFKVLDFLIGDIKMYLLFILFFHTDMTDTIEPLYSTISGVHEMRLCYRRIVVK